MDRYQRSADRVRFQLIDSKYPITTADRKFLNIIILMLYPVHKGNFPDMGGVSPKDARLRVTWWHASLFSQIFSLMIFLALGVWYIIVASAPGYISEYLPAESSADAGTILGDFVIVIVWLVLIFFTWKQRKPAFLASVAASLFFLVLVSISFLYAKSLLSAPDFSDFIWYPDSVMIIIFGVMAYRSFSRKT